MRTAACWALRGTAAEAEAGGGRPVPLRRIHTATVSANRSLGSVPRLSELRQGEESTSWNLFL